ncbi:hypothetical protein SAMN05444156_1054 [Verrucomicrobium sp. GAS474]|nr:hypothetical protein [Verrucomicrobium sp. GAS474]SDT95702.1 hypothetical protein SAMN05444156_1054 [Verrucomicrobium sp. GAS474]
MRLLPHLCRALLSGLFPRRRALQPVRTPSSRREGSRPAAPVRRPSRMRH